MSGSSDTCLLCGKPRSESYKPFCSKRCADIDLGRWLKGGYAIPGVENETEENEPPGPPSNDDEMP
jgi:endogenous inhibitor of DNA gyrase (YacG/DUF329 family)